MYATTPRLAASRASAGSSAESRATTGQEASRTIFSISPSACSEERPSSTSATSGCSLTVSGADLFDVCRVGDHFVSETGDDLGEQCGLIVSLVAIRKRSGWIPFSAIARS